MLSCPGKCIHGSATSPSLSRARITPSVLISPPIATASLSISAPFFSRIAPPTATTSRRPRPSTTTSPPIVTISPSRSPLTTTLQPKQLIEPRCTPASIVTGRRYEFLSCAEAAVAPSAIAKKHVSRTPARYPKPAGALFGSTFNWRGENKALILLPRRLQRKARPNVQQSQQFANHVQCVMRRSPPVARVGRICARRPNDNLPAPSLEAAPKPMHSARVRFGSHHDYRKAVCVL